jgi:hypothetical protein
MEDLMNEEPEETEDAKSVEDEDDVSV